MLNQFIILDILILFQFNLRQGWWWCRLGFSHNLILIMTIWNSIETWLMVWNLLNTMKENCCKLLLWECREGILSHHWCWYWGWSGFWRWLQHSATYSKSTWNYIGTKRNWQRWNKLNPPEKYCIVLERNDNIFVTPKGKFLFIFILHFISEIFHILGYLGGNFKMFLLFIRKMTFSLVYTKLTFFLLWDTNILQQNNSNSNKLIHKRYEFMTSDKMYQKKLDMTLFILASLSRGFCVDVIFRKYQKPCQFLYLNFVQCWI